MAITFLRRDDLAPAAFSRELEGDEVGVPASIILVDAGPGEGPGLHVHAYAELFFVLEGRATFTDGEQDRTAAAGELVIVPPEQPHGFVNPGPDRLRQIDVHLNGRFLTRWLDREQA